MRGAPDLFSRQPVYPAAPVAPVAPASFRRERDVRGWFTCEAWGCTETGCFSAPPPGFDGRFPIGTPERFAWFCFEHRSADQAVQP